MRVMPLGDSLTSGTTVEGAYRNRLYSLLTGAGYQVDFVGTLTDANNPSLPDRDHQGQGGYRIDQIQSELSSWLNAIEDPDVVLLMIGTNDFSQNHDLGSVQTRLENLISDIATQRPFAKIIVANLPLRTDDPNLESLQSAFNASIPGIVSNQAALGRQVSSVDMHAILVPGDLVEGVHPTSAGFEKMAAVWLPAVTGVITPLGTSNPPAIVRTVPPVDLQHVSVKFSKPLADSVTSLANFSLSGGLSISQAALDPLTKRTITLTTSTQSPGALYTLTVSGVKDRTPQQNTIAAGSQVDFSSFTLVNGSFEDGETGWTMTGNRIVYDTSPPYVASDGQRMLILNGGQTPPNGVASQTFPTVPGQFYVLDFDIGILALNSAEQRLGVEISGSGPLLSRMESVFGNGLGNSIWRASRHSFTANSATTTLTFRDLSPTTQNLDLLVDHVRITATAVPPNTAPLAANDSYPIYQDVALVIPANGVLANDSDAEGDALTAIPDGVPAHGNVTLNSDGSFTYTPAAGYTGPDSFSYHANDGSFDSNVATVSLTISAGTPDILTNGSFEAGESGWSMTGNRLVYGSDGTYLSSDGANMIIFDAGNTTPNAVISQSFTTIPGEHYKLDFDIGILASNTAEQRLGVEVSGGVPRVSVTESVFGNGQGNSIWSPRSQSFTADSTTTVLTFRDLSSSTSGLDLMLDHVRVTVTPAPPNTAPVAVADSYSTVEDIPLVVPAAGVLANDTDAESNPLTAALNAGPGHGSVIVNANGSFTYTPVAGYTGADSFTYHANDGVLNSGIVTVSITVSPATPGILVNGSFEAGETGWNMSGNRLVYQSDGAYVSTDGLKMVVLNALQTSPSGVISQTFATTPGQSYQLDFDIGILALNSGEQRLGVEVIGASVRVALTETVSGNGLGNSVWASRSHSFTADSASTTLTFRDLSVTTQNLDLLLDHVRVTLTSAPVNTAPVALADAYATNQNTALEVPAAGVLSNDTDPQSDPLTAILNSGPAHGGVALNANGSFTYTPANGYAGLDSFSYHANDGSLDSNVVAVSISVNSGNSQILVNGSFELGYTGWTSSGNQAIEFYRTTDGIREVDFNGRDQAPNGVLSQSFATVSGMTYTLSFDAGILSYVTKNQKLELSVVGNSTRLSQAVPLQGDSTGVTRWTARSYTFVADSPTTTLTFLDRSSTTIGIDLLLDNVRVTGPPASPDASPVAVADSYSVNRNTPLAVSAPGLLANDIAPQTHAPTAVLDAGPGHGYLDLSADGGFYYVPNGDFTGSDSFTYHILDGSRASAPVLVRISVSEVIAGILVNPSFESGFSGWTTSGNLEIEYYASTDGIRTVAFNAHNLVANAVLSQTFATIPGQTYSLDFDAGVLSYTTDTLTLEVSATGNGSLLSETINVTGAGAGSIHWVAQRFTFMAESTSTTLSFRDLSAFTVGIDLLLDHVRVNPLAAPVAEAVVLPPSSTPPAAIGTPSLTLTPGATIISMIAGGDGIYTLQRSGDLAHWATVDSMQCHDLELIEFYDLPDPLATQPIKGMFYRIGFLPGVPGNSR